MMNIDKSKLVLVREKDQFIEDVLLESKEIGYYKDSWNRFKKNKASLVAFIIICIILVFIIIGPYLKKYDLYSRNSTEAARMSNIQPRVPLLEKIGILDGTKTITAGKRFLTYMYHSDYGKGIIISGFPQELVDDPNHPDYTTVTALTVRVDHYRYVNYIRSYMPEDYFSILDENEKQGTNKDPLAPVRRFLNEQQFQEAVRNNHIIDILAIRQSEDPNNPGQYFVNYEVRLHQFKFAIGQAPEDTYFWFGTTGRGQDLFTMIWVGARISLIMAVVVTMINAAIGLTIGSIVGYYGGVLDLIFDRFVEIVASLPFLSILTLLVLRYGSQLWVIVLAFTITGWIGSYGTGRMQFYRFKNREYVLSARTLGASDARIMFKHIFPNTLGLIVTGYALAIPSFVFLEASYSFLNIINYSEATSVGMLIQQGQSVMDTFPHLLLFPAVYISVLMIVFNLFGNGLRDAFNPSLRGVE